MISLESSQSFWLRQEQSLNWVCCVVNISIICIHCSSFLNREPGPFAKALGSNSIKMQLSHVALF